MDDGKPHMHEVPDVDEDFLVGPPQQGQTTPAERTGSLHLAKDDVGICQLKRNRVNPRCSLSDNLEQLMHNPGEAASTDAVKGISALFYVYHNELLSSEMVSTRQTGESANAASGYRTKPRRDQRHERA
ncbi:hypothetical protein MY10362_006067 [Beauveria mimosiformis]